MAFRLALRVGQWVATRVEVADKRSLQRGEGVSSAGKPPSTTVRDCKSRSGSTEGRGGAPGRVDHGTNSYGANLVAVAVKVTTKNASLYESRGFRPQQRRLGCCDRRGNPSAGRERQAQQPRRQCEAASRAAWPCLFYGGLGLLWFPENCSGYGEGAGPIPVEASAVRCPLLGRHPLIPLLGNQQTIPANSPGRSKLNKPSAEQ